MPDHVLIDGDLAIFRPIFGPAVVAVRPGALIASGPATRGQRRLCVLGDERSVVVPGCMYVSGGFIVPGVGTLEIARLAPDQIADKSRSRATLLMLVGTLFIAKFTIQSPATTPIGVPDGTPMYLGDGSFTTTNAKLRAT